MLFLQGLGVKIIIVNCILRALAWLPGAWKWRFKSFFGDEKELAVLVDVHAQEASIFFNFFCRWVIIIIQLLFHELEAVKTHSSS